MDEKMKDVSELEIKESEEYLKQLMKEPSAYDLLNVTSLEEMAEKAKGIEEDAENKKNEEEVEYAEGNLKRFFSLVKRDVKRFKKEIVIIALYLLITANLILTVATSVYDFIYINTQLRVWRQPVFIILECIIPFAVWAWSSLCDAFNFYRIKFFLFRYCCLNCAVLMFTCYQTAILRFFCIFFFSLPTSGTLKPEVIVIGFYVLCAGILVFSFIALYLQIRRFTRERLMYRWITRFRIAKLLPDMPWQRRFAYDMCIVRNLITGKMHRIYEADRRLHSKVVGSTGGGKTATIMTVVYESDVKRKAKNIDYQKRKIKKLLEKGKVFLTRIFEDIDFNIDYVKPLPSLEESEYKKVEKKLNKLKYTSKNAGITAMCPNEAFADELYKKAKAKGHRINRVDPCLNPDGTHKEDFVGFSPIYVPLIEGEDEDSYMFRVFTAAKLYADVNQAIFELGGDGNPYFTGLNKNLSVTAAVTVIIAYPLLHPGEYATLEHIQQTINDFKQIKPYRDALIGKYGKKSEMGVPITTPGRVKVGPNLQFIVDRIDRDFLGPNSEKINDQATGLRNIIDESLMNPRIKKILCAKKTLNLDRALEMGELTIVNFDISLGSDSTGFGMFFMLSFIQAVLRRPGTERTRLPHFYSIDEAPMLFHPRLELSTTLFRQYNVAMLLFMQSLNQYEKNDTTRYLKNVLTGNCAHQIIFGRASKEDMEFYAKLSGYKWEVEESESVRETALSDENTAQQFTHSFELEQNERISMDDVRYRDFLECTVFSTKKSTPLEPFLGKTNFLPRGYDPRMRRYHVNWQLYYDSSLIPLPKDEKDIVGYKKDGAVTSIQSTQVVEEAQEEIRVSNRTPLFAASAEELHVTQGYLEQSQSKENEREVKASPAETDASKEPVSANSGNIDSEDDWEEL